MWKSFKAQIAIYKWIIILSIIGLLALGLGYQYHRSTQLANSVTTLTENNKELTTQITKATDRIQKQEEAMDNAIADLKALRDTYSAISGTTQQLKSQLDKLKRPPAPGGANAKELEDEANAYTKRVFDRIENASKGKTTE